MFCDTCQTFWKEAFSHAQIPQLITKCEDIKWSKHEKVLHHNLRELKHASDTGCPICRAILFTPTEYETADLLADQDEAINIVLDIDPSRGPHPVLSASFMEVGDGKVARIPKRMLAACGGLLTDGRSSTTALNFELT